MCNLSQECACQASPILCFPGVHVCKGPQSTMHTDVRVHTSVSKQAGL